MKRLFALLLFALPALAYELADFGPVRVLYQTGQEALAEAVGRRALLALSVLEPTFGKPPRPLTLRLDPKTEFYNGYASVFPRPHATLFPAFPYYGGAFWNTADPLYTLVLHELVHLLHLRGPENALGLIPNGVARPYPAWLTEGLATYFESQGGGGRLHDAYTEGLLRALAERPPTLAEASVAFFPRFPYGELRYRVGVAFVDYLVKKHGLSTLLASFSRYQQTPMPFSLYLPDGFAEAWKETAGTELANEWRAFWESRPKTGKAPSPRGPAGRSPAVLGKRLAYLQEDAIVVGDRVFPHPLGRSVGRLAWLNARTLVFDRLDPTPDGTYVRRLFTLDVETGRETPVPGAVHAYYPTTHKGTIYYVEEGPAGSRLIALRGGKKKVRYRAKPGRHLVGVAASEEGLAILVWEQGRVFPVLLGEKPKALRAPGRILKDLAWWRKKLVFASDADGVYGLYALDPQSGRVETLVSHPYGAFAPAARGEALVYTVLTARGFYLDESVPKPRPAARAPAPPLPAPALPDAKPRTRTYDPLPSLAPVGWLPLAPLGALTLGVDDAGELDWLLAANTDLERTALVFSAGYTPRFGLAPERYGLELTYSGSRPAAVLGYARRFLAGRTTGTLALSGGAVSGAPYLGFSLALARARALGRDRVWGEAREGTFLRLEAGYLEGFSGALRLEARTREGLIAGFAFGENAPGFWLGPGPRGAVFLGLRRNLVLDAFLGDGLFYLSHLELRPRAGLLFAPGTEPTWGMELALKAHLAFRYYLPFTPELRLGYRADRGLSLGFGF